jgi:dihydrofolate reductase
MAFDVVVAHDAHRGIGINNQLPWHCPADMAHFKALTTGNKTNAVIMGRNTWESLPAAFSPLPDRHNIVLSTTQLEIPGATVTSSLTDALSIAASATAIFVIGGAQIYAMALAHEDCRTLHVTKIFRSFDCDVTFPDYSLNFRCEYASNIWVHANGNCAFYRYNRR